MKAAAWDNRSYFILFFHCEVRNLFKIARIAIGKWFSLPPSVSPRRDVQNGIGFIIPGWILAPNKRESAIYIYIYMNIYIYMGMSQLFHCITYNKEPPGRITFGFSVMFYSFDGFYQILLCFCSIVVYDFI